MGVVAVAYVNMEEVEGVKVEVKVEGAVEGLSHWLHDCISWTGILHDTTIGRLLQGLERGVALIYLMHATPCRTLHSFIHTQASL